MDTTQIPKDFKEFLKLFVDHDVRFMLVGGYAVNAFGYSRNTSDIDIWVANDTENDRRVVRAIRAFGFSQVPDDVFADADSILRMGVAPLRIEVFKSIAGVEFEDCWSRRVTFEAGDLTIPMISLEDLRRNKRAAGRPKDLVDLDELA